MRRYKRIFVIVLDSLGIGAMEDSADYGDFGVNTLGHIIEQTRELNICEIISFIQRGKRFYVIWRGEWDSIMSKNAK